MLLTNQSVGKLMAPWAPKRTTHTPAQARVFSPPLVMLVPWGTPVKWNPQSMYYISQDSQASIPTRLLITDKMGGWTITFTWLSLNER